VATDLPNVIDSVLAQNVIDNAHLVAGNIQVRELDWTVEPEYWSWTDTKSVSSPSLSKDSPTLLGPPFDLIVTSDTLYIPQLAQPLLRTIHALASLSSGGRKSPLILLCFERRDPSLIDHTLNDARKVWGLNPERIPHKKLVQAMGKAGLEWDKGDWDGVELWKLKLEKPSKGATGRTNSEMVGSITKVV
jgi:protein N-lysine methyltransferase METTL21D